VSGGRLNIALAAAAGFLVGVILVVVLGGPAAKVRTVTAPPPASTAPGGRVIQSTAVPDVVGNRLDIAKQRVRRAGFIVHQSGGGVLGVIQDRNWQVVTQDPTAGTTLALGSTVTLDIERP
jgi:beta-lactam-binding protein with PASTA domain